MRHRQRDVLKKATGIGQEDVPGRDTPNVLDQTITQEEASLLQQTLEQISETYREPLVLYYREQESVSRVAELMGIC